MRIYSTQIEKGKDYQDMLRVIQINFINKMLDNLEKEINSSQTFGEDFRVDFVRLDKVPKISYTTSRYMKWIQYIGAQSEEVRREIAKGDEVLMELTKIIDEFCNEARYDETLSREYWNKRIYGYEGEKRGIIKGEKRGRNLGKKKHN